MAVIYLNVCHKPCKTSGYISQMVCDRHKKSRVLKLVDAAGRQIVRASLEQAHIEIVDSVPAMPYIPNRLVCTRLESVFTLKIILLPHIDDMTSSVRIVFYVVYEIFRKVPFPDGRSVALPDRAVSYIPLIPPCYVVFVPEKIKVIGHIAVYPQKFSYRRLYRYGAEGDERGLSLRKIICARHMIYRKRMSRSPIRIVRTRIYVKRSLIQYFFYDLSEINVTFCHCISFP